MDKDDLLLLQKKVTALRAEGKYIETIEACFHLLDCGLKVNDFKSILTAHINSAASYYCIGEIEEAFISIDKYEEICMINGDETDKLNSYNILFLLYDYTKEFKKAKKTLEKSIDLGRELKRYNIVSNGYSNYSHISLIENDYAKALEMAKLGLEMAGLHVPESPILKLRVKLNIASAYIGLGDFVTSGSLINEMIHNPILELFGREKSQCYVLQGRWYAKQNLTRNAFESLSIAKELVESYNDVYLLKEIQEERCELCELMNDVSLGYVVQKEYITLLNEISEREIAMLAQRLEVKHNIATIERKSNTDYLTGLYNRSFIEETTNEWLKQASIKNESIVCIAFDIDNFKSINDEYGHLFGDEVIKQVSSACLSSIRKIDLIGRFGGDEFVILLKDFSLEDGKLKAEQLLEIIRDIKLFKDGNTISVTASIGVSTNADCTIMHFNELFNFADIKLYEAKQNGKNRICVLN
ncbi:GGDEF domain-containing protein [Sporosarcina sp. BP05]|uniref:GGDEF domain-containing protein n=1 Tax=Sporosarcina sp. BP05 TaxID=2758726 RepID=UPI001644FA0B|nr:GGDEF domain-containing protein [Sporosarcina sp. BP05]